MPRYQSFRQVSWRRLSTAGLTPSVAQLAIEWKEVLSRSVNEANFEKHIRAVSASRGAQGIPRRSFPQAGLLGETQCNNAVLSLTEKDVSNWDPRSSAQVSIDGRSSAVEKAQMG